MWLESLSNQIHSLTKHVNQKTKDQSHQITKTSIRTQKRLKSLNHKIKKK